MSKKTLIAALLSVSVFLVPSSASAVQQEVTFTINPDFSASGVWKIPVSGQTGNIYEFSNFDNFGSTGVMDYTLRTIANSEGELPLDKSGGGIIVHNIYKAGGHGGINDLFVTYDVKTVLSKPLALYEVWVAGGGYFNSPVIKISYPKGWKVVGTYPSGSQTEGSISIDYPTDTSYITPVLVAFIPTDLGSGNIVTKSGRFTFAGDRAAVKKLEQAVAKMTYLESVLKDSAGLTLPDSITVYAGDLRNVDVGYEAEALAAKPNVILYNKDFLVDRSLETVQTILLHEITHLAEQNLSLYKGAPYIAPWFKEGLSVFVENRGRKFIYPNPADAAVADVFGESHIFTPTELKEREAYSYDYLFNGDNTTTIGESYSLAGVTLQRFFDSAGADGMQKLFGMMKDGLSNQVLPLADSDHITSFMSSITGLAKDDLLYPYEKSATFESDVVGLTRPEYSDSEADAIVAAIKKRVPNYLSGSTVAESGPAEENEPSVAAPETTPKSIISAVTSFFGIGKEEKTEVKTEEVVTNSATGTPTSTTTAEVPKPETKKGWFELIVNFFKSLFGG